MLCYYHVLSQYCEYSVRRLCTGQSLFRLLFVVCHCLVHVHLYTVSQSIEHRRQVHLYPYAYTD